MSTTGEQLNQSTTWKQLTLEALLGRSEQEQDEERFREGFQAEVERLSPSASRAYDVLYFTLHAMECVGRFTKQDYRLLLEAARELGEEDGRQ